MAGLEFAKRLMRKYGWTEGKGLGREEAGVAEALKPKLKFDNAGLGHDAGEEFKFQWWDHVFNQAASNISVVKDQEGAVKVSGMGRLKVSKTRPSGGDSGTKCYGGFIKGGTVVGLEEEQEEVREERREIKDHSLKLTDDQLFHICGGLTAHKGARHGLTMSAKLVRIKEQEQKLMEAWSKGDQAKKKRKKNMKREQEEETNGDSAGGNTDDFVTEIFVQDEFLQPEKKKKKKRKKEQEREESEKQSLVQTEEEMASQEEIPKQKKKKKKKKKREREEDEENLELGCERVVMSEVHILEKKKKRKKRFEQEDLNVHESQADAKDSDKVEGKSTLKQNNIECLPVGGKKKKKSKKRGGGENDARSSENSDDNGIEQKNLKDQSLSSDSAASSKCEVNAKKKKGEEFQDEKQNCVLNVDRNFDMTKKMRDHSDMHENCGELANMKITKEKKKKIEEEGTKGPSRECEREIQPKKKRKKKDIQV